MAVNRRVGGGLRLVSWCYLASAAEFHRGLAYLYGNAEPA